MNAVNAVPLLILVWTFTAVCQADDGVSVICGGVTGTVGENITLTCSVSLECTERCIKMYKFQYTENYKDSEICRQEFPRDPCEQRNSFTCRFIPTKAMTEQFTFFVQTLCGGKSSEFTVSITEPTKPERLEDPGNEGPKTAQEVKTVVVPGSKKTFIPAVVGCFFIILIIITLLTILYKTKSNHQTQGIPGFLGHRHDEDSNSPVDMI